MKSSLTPSDLGLSQFQFDNLHKLLAYAKAHSETPFDISRYIKEPGTCGSSWFDLVTNDHPCGTTCCLAGMALFAGIPFLEGEWWYVYLDRIFTSDNDIVEYLFSEDHLNSLPHAIARLEDFLSNGLPQDVKLNTHEVL
jgi:hypothetical protein